MDRINDHHMMDGEDARCAFYVKKMVSSDSLHFSGGEFRQKTDQAIMVSSLLKT